MIKQICVCDKCGKEVEELLAFQIICKTKDSHCHLGEDIKTEYKEFCSSCFDNLLDSIGVNFL